MLWPPQAELHRNTKRRGADSPWRGRAAKMVPTVIGVSFDPTVVDLEGYLIGPKLLVRLDVPSGSQGPCRRDQVFQLRDGCLAVKHEQPAVGSHDQPVAIDMAQRGN